VASSLQARIESVALHSHGDPADIVGEVNRTLCDSSEGGRFATLLYFDIDARAADIALVNAGHPAPVLSAVGAERRLFDSTGPALGILPDATFRVHRFAMPEGATLFAYSDGVTEAFNAAGDEFGETRLLAALAAHADASAATLCRLVIDDVRRHADGHAGDDITVLALRR